MPMTDSLQVNEKGITASSNLLGAINPVFYVHVCSKIQKQIHLHSNEVKVNEIYVTFCDLGLIFITLTLV